MLIAFNRFISPVSIFQRLRPYRLWQHELKIQVRRHKVQCRTAPPYGRRKNLSDWFHVARTRVVNENSLFKSFNPFASFRAFSQPPDDEDQLYDIESNSDSSEDRLMSRNDVDMSEDLKPQSLDSIFPDTSQKEQDETDLDEVFISGDKSESSENTDDESSVEDFYASENSYNNSSLLDADAQSMAQESRHEISKKLDPPDATIYHRYKETYFQWDYRNHRKLEGSNRCNVLRKIERTLKNAHLEPFGRRRGVQTVRMNILAFDIGTKYRLGQSKSFVKKKRIQTHENEFKKPSRKRILKRINNLLRPNKLLDSIFRLINERHAIYSSRQTTEIGALDRYTLGESFFGPTTHISMTAKTAKMILKELWLYGRSRMFSKLQDQHNSYQNLLKSRIRGEKLNQ